MKILNNQIIGMILLIVWNKFFSRFLSLILFICVFRSINIMDNKDLEFC